MPNDSLTVRDRILQAASDLLAEGGTDAVSTRAVCARAGVQQPTLYRLFGDKRGLLESLTSYAYDRYVADKLVAQAGTSDPAELLRHGWDNHVRFGLKQPALYMLMYTNHANGERSAAANDAYLRLCALTEKAAAAGVLRAPSDVAAQMLQATVIGVTLHLIASGADPTAALSARTRDAMLAAVLVSADEEPEDYPAEHALAARAVALDASITESTHILTDAETTLLREWLRRLAGR